MELRHLRYFLVLAEELNFTRAAERLRMSQPPLSQQIRDLEATVGAALLRRTSRKVELTAAGEVFRRHAQAILQRVELARDDARSVGSGYRGTIGIGATGSILRGPLADLLSAYRKANPDVAISLQEQAPALQMQAIINRQTDVSFNRSIAVADHLISEKAWSETVVVAMPSHSVLAARKQLHLADLQHEELIMLHPDSSDFARSLQQACIDAGFLPKISQLVIDSQSIPGLIAAGFGLSLVPASIQRLTSNDILFRPLAGEAPVADVHMVSRRDEPSPVVHRFLDFARAFLGNQENA